MTDPHYVERRPPHVGFRLVHRRYIDHSEAHYAGNLASGAFVVGLFGDVATDLCIQVDHDEGLFASYSEVNFHDCLHAGDVLEVSAEIVRVGRRSRTVQFDAHVVSRARLDHGTSAAGVLVEPLRITSAVGTVVVPTRYDEPQAQPHTSESGGTGA